MLTYKIRAYKGTGSYLTVDGQTPITLYRNVSLQSEDASKIQTWTIPSLTSGVIIRPTAGTQYTLGIQTSDSNCQMVTINSASGVNFISADGTGASGLYRIQLKSDSTKYLTAGGKSAGSNVYWAAPNSSLESQIWQIVITGNVLDMPAGRNCNWNQKCNAVVSLFGSGACTLTAGLDVANFYATNGSGYTPASMNSTTYWGPSGYTWKCPGPGTIGAKVQKSTHAQYFVLIKSEIDSGHPVLITIKNSDGYHTVFAYGYTNGAATAEDILVFDPANSGNTQSENGRVVTLQNAMEYNSGKYTIDSIRTTYAS